MSVQIARIDGIPIKLHFTLVIAFFLISWTLATNFMPSYLPGLSTAEYWIMGAIGSVVLFMSVLLHELAHSKVAMRYGIKIRQIVLFLFGGVSDITEELKDYRKEAKMALAGPLTSFAIAGGFALALWLLMVAGVQGLPIVQGILYYGALINAMLGVFNLLPAFPSDGGRVLRAMLVRRKKDYNKATEIAAKVGIAISYLFIGAGFLAMFAGSFVSGLWILLIGWFLMSGAQSYLAQLQLSTALSATKVRDIMNTNVISVKPTLNVNDLLQNYFQTYMKSAFPVVNEKNQLLGMVTLKRALDVQDYKRSQVTAAEVMIPREELAVVGPDLTADMALVSMTKTKVGKVFVCDDYGVLVGLVSKTDILSVEFERQEYFKEIKTSS